MYYFDPKTSGFYLSKAKELIGLSDEEYWYLINGQAEGNVITVGDDGKPRLEPFQKPHEEVLLAANSQRDGFLGVAALRIAPLQNAIDLKIATDADRENLKLWKQYSVDVNRVVEQPAYPNTITWPTPPDE